MIRSILLVSAALAATTPAMAKDRGDAATLGNPDKKVCRYDGATGSMMRKRVCHTALEWKQIDEANAANARQMVNHNNMNRPAIGNQ